MKSACVCCLLLASTFTVNGHATTWTEPQPVPDPVRQGAQCYVSEPMSWGSYIYEWPSKYDQVFWPLIDPKGLWFCRESGFTAFIGDFEPTADERTALTSALASYKPIEQPSLRDKLVLLQQSYAARGVDARMQIRLLRVLAYYYETDLEELDAAHAFRQQALELIQVALRSELPEGERLEYLFVSAVYYREFGDTERSKAALQALEQALEQSKDESGLKKDIDRIVPGGPLIPEQPERL